MPRVAPGTERVPPPLYAAVPGVAAWTISPGCNHRRRSPSARRNRLRRSQSGKVAGLLHRSEGEVVVVVLPRDDASMNLVRTGAAGVERTVGVEGKSERVIGRVDLNRSFASVCYDRIGIGARSVGTAAENC